MYYDLPTLEEVRSELQKLIYKALHALALESGVGFGTIYQTRKNVRNPGYEVVHRFLRLVPRYINDPQFWSQEFKREKAA